MSDLEYHLDPTTKQQLIALTRGGIGEPQLTTDTISINGTEYPVGDARYNTDLPKDQR